MSQLDKLRARICSKPKDFTWDELVKLLAAYGFESLTKGKTAGSRRQFYNPNYAGGHQPAQAASRQYSQGIPAQGNYRSAGHLLSLITLALMENALVYKGYVGSVQYNAADEIFHGKIEAITDLVTFEADSAKQLRPEFEQAVDDYLALCAAVGKEPAKTFTGSFNVRLGPELHRKAALVSTGRGISLNQLVSQAVSQFVAQAE